MNRLEEFEFWTNRRMLKLSWTEHKSNGEILTVKHPEITAKDHQENDTEICFGHIARKNSIQRLVIKKKIEGIRER